MRNYGNHYAHLIRDQVKRQNHCFNLRVDKTTAPHMPRFVKQNQEETINSCYGIWFVFKPILSCPKFVHKHWKRLFKALANKIALWKRLLAVFQWAPSGLRVGSQRAPSGLPEKLTPRNFKNVEKYRFSF